MKISLKQLDSRCRRNFLQRCINVEYHRNIIGIMRFERAIRINLLLFILFSVSCSGGRAPFTDGIRTIETVNYANRSLSYYYFIPWQLLEEDLQTAQFLICVPGLSGRGDLFVGDQLKNFALENNLVIIAPSFKYDADNWESRQSYQYPSVWSGQAFLDILQDFQHRYDIEYETLVFIGVSAGAQFALRFSLQHPEKVSACAEYGTGGMVVPDRYVPVKFLIGIGLRDTGRIDKAAAFTNKARELGIDVTYREFDSDHDTPAQFITDSLTFFNDSISK